jgi:hypothetical protein
MHKAGDNRESATRRSLHIISKSHLFLLRQHTFFHSNNPQAVAISAFDSLHANWPMIHPIWNEICAAQEQYT